MTRWHAFPSPVIAPLRATLRAVFFALVWYLLWTLAVVMGESWQASLWYPPAAFSIALFLRFRTRAIPMVGLGIGFTALQDALLNQTGDPRLVLVWLAFTFSHAVAYGGFARMIRWRRWMSGNRRDAAVPTDAYSMLFAPVFCGIQTLFGLIILWAFTDIPADVLIQIAPTRFCGDLVAVVTLTFPFYLLIRTRFSWRRMGLDIAVLPFIAGITALFAGMTWLGQMSGATIPLSMAAYVQILPLLFASGTLRSASLYFLVAWSEILFVLEAWVIGRAAQAIDYQGAMLAVASAAYIGSAISSLKRERNQLRQLAITDPLTGLANRRAALATIETELIRARRRGTPLSLAILDIDHFKRINDEFGHEEGDRALIAAASALRDTVRAGDIVARWGGEEFLICCPDTAPGGAAELCERCRAALAQIRIGADASGPRAITASFGLVQVQPQERLHEAIARADRLLYRAKAEGRNRVEVDFPSLRMTLAVANE